MNMFPKWYSPPHIERRRRNSGSAVVTAVMNEFNIDKQSLISPSRSKKPVRARQVAWYVMSRNCGHMSYLQMAKMLGRTDHSTAFHGVRVVENLIERDHDFAAAVERVERALRD
jgi:chromosomal replication initiation ATPase DnaA